MKRNQLTKKQRHWIYIKRWRKKEKKKYIDKMTKNNERECYFYVVKLFNDSEVFIKVGITIDLIERFKQIPYNHKLLVKEIMPLNKAFDLETSILKQLHFKGNRYKPQDTFGGNTECFTTSALLIMKDTLSANNIFRL